MQEPHAPTAASRPRLGSLPKALPTLATEARVRAPGQKRACVRPGRAPQLRSLNVLRAGGCFPAQRTERAVLQVQRVRDHVPPAARARAFLCQLKRAVPGPEF